MPALVTILGDNSADLLRDLHSWLSDEPELRARVVIREQNIGDEALGPVVDGLQIILGAGGAAATAASVLIAWLSNRAGEISVKLTREGGDSLEVTAKGVRGLNGAGVHEVTTRITQLLGRADDQV